MAYFVRQFCASIIVIGVLMSNHAIQYGLGREDVGPERSLGGGGGAAEGEGQKGSSSNVHTLVVGDLLSENVN